MAGLSLTKSGDAPALRGIPQKTSVINKIAASVTEALASIQDGAA